MASYTLNSSNTSNPPKWARCTRAKPCEICGKATGCLRAPDGMAVYCWHDGEPRVIQLLPKSGNGKYHRLDPPPTRPKKTYTSADAALATVAKSATLRGWDLVTTWTYPGNTMRVARFDPPAGVDAGKQFRPVHRLNNGAWAVGDPARLLPLYRGDELPPVGTVYIVEGEKATDRARSVGLAAVTSAHGSAAPAKSDWTPLAGREVVILPDADEAGEHYAAEVTRIVTGLTPPARAKIVRLPGLPAGGDIVEFDESIGSTPEATKAVIEELASQSPGIESEVSGPVLKCLADVEPRQVQWLWHCRIPSGRISLLIGRPGEGKSFLTTDLAARVSTGSSWPDGSGNAPKGSVIIISGEDDPHDTIRPRLDAHHADVSRIHLLTMVRRTDDKGKTFDTMFTLADVTALEAALQQVKDCRLVIVDPVGSFIGGRTDAHRDNEVRAVLAPVALLAEKYGCAVLIVAHRRKASGNVADDLALGSRAFTGIARACWHLSHDAEDKGRKLLLPGKNNLAPEGDGLAFRISGDPPSIVWERERVQLSADDALAIENEHGSGKPGPEPVKQNAAKEWLQTILRDGPMYVGDTENSAVGTIRAEAKDASLSWATVRRAMEELGVKSGRCPYTKKYQWRLPKLVAQMHNAPKNLSNLNKHSIPKENEAGFAGTIAGCSGAAI
jgi:putative DNA primase/helicase